MKTNLIGFPTKPHEEIIRLYITVKKPLLMHVLNSVNLNQKPAIDKVSQKIQIQYNVPTRCMLRKELDQFLTKKTFSHHLIGKHKHSLQRELSAAVVEQVLKTWPQKINNHHIILALNTEPLQVWDASCNQGMKKVNSSRGRGS
jgi:hypothetical protein